MQEISALMLATDQSLIPDFPIGQAARCTIDYRFIRRLLKDVGGPVEGDEARPCSRSLFEQGQCPCGLGKPM
jgi:hypothetical protein